MNSLKSAFGKEDKFSDKFSSNISQSMRKFGKGKSQSMWAFEADEKNEEISLDADTKLQMLNGLLKTSFQKDKNLSMTTFDRLTQDFQDSLGTSSSKSQISYYLVLQDKISDLLELYSKSKADFVEEYLSKFHEKVEDRILLLRSKDKTNDLKDYDKIVNKNFKKKNDFLDVGGSKIQSHVKSRQKSRQNKNSNQKKLNRLFSKQKGFKERQFKRQENHDDYLQSQTMVQNNESVSYSAIMSTSVAVKQRRPRKKSGHYQDNNYMPKTQVKQHKNVENEEEQEGADKAFIFYRPKKGKKN